MFTSPLILKLQELQCFGQEYQVFDDLLWRNQSKKFILSCLDKTFRVEQKNATRNWSYLLSQLVFQERRMKLSAEVIAKLGYLHEVRNMVT